MKRGQRSKVNGKGNTTKQSEAAEINGKQKLDCIQQMSHFHARTRTQNPLSLTHPPSTGSRTSAGRYPVAATDSFLLPPLLAFFLFFCISCDSFCLFFGRVLARKLGKYCFAFRGFSTFFHFHIFLFFSFPPFFSASNKRISISMANQSGGMLFGRRGGRLVGGMGHVGVAIHSQSHRTTMKKWQKARQSTALGRHYVYWPKVMAFSLKCQTAKYQMPGF